MKVKAVGDTGGSDDGLQAVTRELEVVVLVVSRGVTAKVFEHVGGLTLTKTDVVRVDEVDTHATNGVSHGMDHTPLRKNAGGSVPSVVVDLGVSTTGVGMGLEINDSDVGDWHRQNYNILGLIWSEYAMS